ncbi:MAG: type III-A CRISPR-associated RAMP protein Csm5 [Lachnospiraceae bacterium]|nr:type III-A CRISPR-associated RAMP protein Csm5 [Lachnospiraceae bacterium]
MAENNKILEHFRLVLTTDSPVFIGDGGKLNKKEYIRKGQTVYVPNKQKMYRALIQKKLVDKYEDYMLSSDWADLGGWLEKQRIYKETYSSWIDYTLNCDLEASGKGQVRMMTCIKDSYGNPYVPGSSIKGALRTILLAYLIDQDSKKYNGLRDRLSNEANRQRFDWNIARKKYLEGEIKDIETEALHTLKRKAEEIQDAVNDMMACLRISDSKPLKTSDLIMCQKWDMNPNGIIKTINTARECIKPGVKIEFDVTIDLRRGYPEDQRAPFSIQMLKDAIEYFARQYVRCFFKPFKELGKISGCTHINNMIWLGGGVGYVSKTIVYPMLGKDAGLTAVSDIMQKTVNNRDHHHENDQARGVSPHMVKCTRYNGELYEFGRCLVQFFEE